MNAIQCENLSKRYGDKLVLDEVSLEVPEGKIFGLLGPNGAGKTTLIRIINQITGPDSGKVSFFGEALSRKHISRVGYLPEERGLYKKMKVGEQALYLAQLKGLSKKEASTRLKYWFDKFNIGDWWDKEVQALSKGMAQKVQFIVTVLHQPDLLIFDEPFSGFDPVNANIIRDEILELNANGTTILFSTHRMESVEQLCEHIALINHSKMILHSPLRELKESYRSNMWVADWYADDLPTHWPVGVELQSSALLGGKYELEFELESSQSVSNLVSYLLANGVLHGLREKLPSLQDIFIERVTQ
jgi:ABC-2 type transport system ATP-binding protein